MFGLESRSGKRFVRRWQAASSDHVISLAWSADHNLLAAAAVSGPITVFAATTGQVLQTLPGHHFGTAMIAAHPRDAKQLASAGQDGLVKLWNLEQTPTCVDLKGGAAWVERLAWSPGGEFLASGAGRKLRVWEASGQVKRELPDQPSTIADLKWNPNSLELASAAYGKLSIWVPDKAEPKQQFSWKGSMLTLAWSPDGKHLATGDQDSTVHFWILDTGKDLQMSGYQTKVRELSWDCKSRYLATGGGTVPCIWDCSGSGPENTRPLMFEGHEELVSALTFQHQGPLLASGGMDGLVALWHPGQTDKMLDKAEFDSPVSQLVWASDDKHLGVGLASGEVVVLGLR